MEYLQKKYVKRGEQRMDGLDLKAENQELRNENEELKIKEYRSNKRMIMMENALKEIKKTISENQLGSVINYQNKIRKVLDTLESKLELNNIKSI